MIYILYNPLSNGGNGRKGLADVQAAFGAGEADTMDITALDTSKFISSLCPDDRVVLCGGDGTLHRFVNDLKGQAPAVPIQIWRYGTGNDFLRDVSSGKDDTIILNDHMRRLPLAETNGERRFFLNGCSCGVDAVVCAMMEANRFAPKKSGYAITAINAFFRNYRPMNGRVTVDGVTREYKDLWIACTMNGRFQGGGMCFAPGQDRSGDTLTCMVVHGTSPVGTLLRFPFVIVGRHTGLAACDIRVGREIVVELDGSSPIQLDGEVIDGVSGYTVRK